jgi:hypothetical protein
VTATFSHEGHRAIDDRAEVLILQLLSLRRLRAEESPAGVDQIRTRQVEVAIDEEVFLLGTAGRDDALGGRAEELEHADRLLGERFHRAEQRRLLVERLASPAQESRRNDERDRAARLQQPRRAGRIPRGMAAGLEGGAHAASFSAVMPVRGWNQCVARPVPFLSSPKNLESRGSPRSSPRNPSSPLFQTADRERQRPGRLRPGKTKPRIISRQAEVCIISEDVSLLHKITVEALSLRPNLTK